MRRRRAYVLASLGLLVLSWGIAWAVTARRDRADLERANREIAAGQFGAARRLLARLSARRPGRAEVEFPLGYCEAAEGDLDAALSAWCACRPSRHSGRARPCFGAGLYRQPRPARGCRAAARGDRTRSRPGRRRSAVAVGPALPGAGPHRRPSPLTARGLGPRARSRRRAARPLAARGRNAFHRVDPRRS